MANAFWQIIPSLRPDNGESMIPKLETWMKSPFEADRRLCLDVIEEHCVTMKVIYCGAKPEKMLNTSRQILKVVLACIGSQWSCCRDGEIWSHGLRFLMTRAAVYWCNIGCTKNVYLIAQRFSA
jgi:hypothetical protein